MISEHRHCSKCIQRNEKERNEGETAKLATGFTPINRLLLNSFDPKPGINRIEDSFAITSKEKESGF
jgi:hypothetical protein